MKTHSEGRWKKGGHLEAASEVCSMRALDRMRWGENRSGRKPKQELGREDRGPEDHW